MANKPHEMAEKLREIVKRFGTSLWPDDAQALMRAATYLDCIRREGESEADYVARLLQMADDKE